MADTPREGRADWAAIAASRRRPQSPKLKIGFDRLPSAEASASSPHEPLTRPESGGAERVLPQGGLHEGAHERTELVTWLKKVVVGDDNRSFKPREQAKITTALRELQVEVSALAELNIKQKEELDQSLKKLESSSEEMGRKDWLIYGIGVVTTIVIAEFVPPLALLLPAVHLVHAIGHLFIPDA